MSSNEKPVKIPTYDNTAQLLEERAREEGVSVQEYVDQLTELFMELAKANPEAAIELLRKQRQEEKESEPASFNRKKK